MVVIFDWVYRDWLVVMNKFFMGREKIFKYLMFFFYWDRIFWGD